jgi:hypothetical protein
MFSELAKFKNAIILKVKYFKHWKICLIRRLRTREWVSERVTIRYSGKTIDMSCYWTFCYIFSPLRKEDRTFCDFARISVRMLDPVASPVKTRALQLVSSAVKIEPLCRMATCSQISSVCPLIDSRIANWCTSNGFELSGLRTTLIFRDLKWATRRLLFIFCSWISSNLSNV